MNNYDFPDINTLPVQEGLPDPFTKPDGTRVTSKKEWPEQRAYLKALLSHYIYGKTPPKPEWKILEDRNETVLDGKADCRWITAQVHGNGKSVCLPINVVIPKRQEPSPAVIKNDRFLFLTDTESLRSRIPDVIVDGVAYDEAVLPEAISRGYAMCKFDRTRLARDQKDNLSGSVFELYPDPKFDWGTIAAWAWGYSIVIDVLESIDSIDSERIVATGHSRGGKTALCAGVYEERIAVTAPNSSGAGGTASLVYFENGREPFQKIEHHAEVIPYWWTPRFSEFAGKEDRLPFDAHIPKALIAPRGLVNPHALQDYWANPYGTQITHQAAKPVFDWLGCPENIGLAWREGGHAQGHEDWCALLDFCDKHFFDKTVDRDFGFLPYPDIELPIKWAVPG